MIRQLSRNGSGVVHQFFRASLFTAVSAITLLTIGASAVGYHFLRGQMVEHLHSLANLTAIQSQAAVLFEDPQNASELLQSIPAAGGVQRAELRGRSGRLLAEYSQPPTYLLAGATRWLDAVIVTRDIVVEGHTVGQLTLIGSNEPLVNGLVGLIVSDIVVAALTILLSMLLVTRYTGRITQPLMQLRVVMRNVIEKGDFSQRAPAFALTEAEELGTEFNELLDEIEYRDHELKQANDALERLAFRDLLTGLPNRAMFDLALTETLRDERASALRVALLYLDIDDFKAVNDLHGHDAGDRVLAAIGERLHAWLPQGALAARLGGDEFVVMISPFAHDRDMHGFIEDLRGSTDAPLLVDAAVLQPRLSIGWSLFPDHAGGADELLRAADQSMYAEKRRRRAAAAESTSRLATGDATQYW
jgi:diguanylate cyclase (GGDEF)-like protein